MALTANKLIYGTAGTAAASVSGVDSNGTALTFASAALKAADICDTNGATALVFTATASAVNYLTLANAATGNSPTITATGTNSNIGITIAGKGTGTIALQAGNTITANNQFYSEGYLVGNTKYIKFSDGTDYNCALYRNSSTSLEVNNGTTGTFRDLALRTVLLNNSIQITQGTGSPESVVTAPVGSLYLRSDGGASTTLYVKQSGAGNTGWVAK